MLLAAQVAKGTSIVGGFQGPTDERSCAGSSQGKKPIVRRGLEVIYEWLINNKRLFMYEAKNVGNNIIPRGASMSGSTEPQSELRRELTKMDNLSETLLKAIADLELRINHVLRSATPEGENANLKAVNETALGQELSTYNDRIDRGLMFLGSILQRLEI